VPPSFASFVSRWTVQIFVCQEARAGAACFCKAAPFCTHMKIIVFYQCIEPNAYGF
jgi:hypothetical protein